MSKGLDTLVGGSAGMLSGGQKQRIAIARAFIKKPRIILLDEATSALDKVNEKAIDDAIKNYRETQGNITIVVIAHRLSTIKDADKIVVINKGQLHEMGTHSSLLNDYPNGIYASFVAKQSSEPPEAPNSSDHIIEEDLKSPDVLDKIPSESIS